MVRSAQVERGPAFSQAAVTTGGPGAPPEQAGATPAAGSPPVLRLPATGGKPR
jgi:hypothetical protein